jgi:hypothetical protein
MAVDLTESLYKLHIKFNLQKPLVTDKFGVLSPLGKLTLGLSLSVPVTDHEGSLEV